MTDKETTVTTTGTGIVFSDAHDPQIGTVGATATADGVLLLNIRRDLEHVTERAAAWISPADARRLAAYLTAWADDVEGNR